MQSTGMVPGEVLRHVLWNSLPVPLHLYSSAKQPLSSLETVLAWHNVHVPNVANHTHRPCAVAFQAPDLCSLWMYVSVLSPCTAADRQHDGHAVGGNAQRRLSALHDVHHVQLSRKRPTLRGAESSITGER